jgi:hypothetical protein
MLSRNLTVHKGSPLPDILDLWCLSCPEMLPFNHDTEEASEA